MIRHLLKYFILFELVISIQISLCQTIAPTWSVHIGGKGDDRGIKVIADTIGNTYITGVFEKEAAISCIGQPDSMKSYGKEDIFFGKINPEGQILWSKHIGGKGSDTPTDIMISGNGDVYLSGIFEDTLFIEVDTILSNDYIDSFIAKFNSLGNLIWIRQISGVGNQQCVSILCDLEGNLITTGHFTKSLEFRETSSEINVSQGGFDGFCAKWTAQGDLIWVRLIQGTGKTFIKDIMIDETNDYYLIGDYTDSISIGNTQFISSSVGNSDVFMLKFLNNGSFSWSRSVGSVYDDKAKCLTLGGNEKMIMVGEFKDDLIYSNHVLLSAEGGDDIFQITINKHGNIQHHKKHGLEKNDFVFDAWIPIGQKVLMASDLRINEGNKNTVLASYGLLGDLCDVYQTGMDLNPSVLSALMADEGQIYYCGSFHGTVTFDEISLTSAGSEDMFLMKMAPEELMLNPYQPDSVINESVTLNVGNYYGEENNIIVPTQVVPDCDSDIFYNYPNPFEDNTQIIYSLPETCVVNLKIIDANGKVLKEWQYSSLPSGNNVLDFNAEEFNSGIYTCKLIAQGETVFISKAIKMIHGK